MATLRVCGLYAACAEWVGETGEIGKSLRGTGDSLQEPACFTGKACRAGVAVRQYCLVRTLVLHGYDFYVPLCRFQYGTISGSFTLCEKLATVR